MEVAVVNTAFEMIRLVVSHFLPNEQKRHNTIRGAMRE
jgi:hypothetical protein